MELTCAKALAHLIHIMRHGKNSLERHLASVGLSSHMKLYVVQLLPAQDCKRYANGIPLDLTLKMEQTHY